MDDGFWLELKFFLFLHIGEYWMLHRQHRNPAMSLENQLRY